MDVEGAEWDILPCLVQNPAVAKLIDTIYLENHCPAGKACCKDAKAKGLAPAADCNPDANCWCPTRGQAGNSAEVMQAALANLTAWGVKMPSYFSPV